MQIDQIGKNGIFQNAGIADAAVHDHKTDEHRVKENDATGIYSANLTRNVTYGRPGQQEPDSLEDIQQQAQNLDAVQMKNEMVVGANTTTAEDAKQMQDDGFSLSDTDIHTVVTETDKIQMELAKAGKDTRYFSNDLSEEQLETMTGNAALAASLSSAFSAQDLPLTEENYADSTKAAKLAESLSELGEGAIKYMLGNNLMPTIANLYQASHSGVDSYVKQPDRSYDNGQFEKQIEQVLLGAGLAVNEENIRSAKWLAANDLAVTGEMLGNMQALQSITFPLETEKLSQQMAQAVADGGRPQDALLAEGYSYDDRAEEALHVIDQATDEDIAYVLDQGQSISIEHLGEAHELLTSETVTIDADRFSDLQKTPEFVTAQRKLQETRLIMTLEANKRLLKQGVSIDTKPLEELVEDLKAQEHAYYRNLLEADGSRASVQQVELFARVDTVAQELPYLPIVAIGSDEYLNTLESLHTTGKALQSRFEQAGESYETMVTAPRRDMGDSIQKAFRNVDEILDRLELEHTQSNERAVRILAYNRMDVTDESVEQVKLAVAQVQEAFDSLKPAVVREMIRDGINPLELSIEQLNETAKKISDELPGQDPLTKFSEYLWKLEQTNSISESERDAYIGIYRLIHQVEAGDGAAIGALVSQGAKLSMKNLLSAMRSGKKQMDYSIDDEFSGVTGTLKGSISEQINRAYQLECFRQVQEIAKEPEQFGDLLQADHWQDQTPEQLLLHLQEQENNEAYQKQIQQRQQAYFESQLQEYTRALQAENQVWSALQNYNIPTTINHVIAMQEMLQDPNGAIRKLMDIGTEDHGDDADLMEEIAQIKEDLIEKMGQDLKTPQELAEAQNTLASVAEHCGQTVMYAKGMTTLDLKQLQTMTKQLSLGRPMANEEHYAIPILTSDGAGMVHVKIVRGKETKGMVGITMESDTLGKVAAKLQAKESGIQGFVAAETPGGVRTLQNYGAELAELLSQAAAEAGIGDRIDVPILQGSNLGLSEFAPMKEQSESDPKTASYEIQTRRLYKIAEKMVTFLKDALEK